MNTTHQTLCINVEVVIVWDVSVVNNFMKCGRGLLTKTNPKIRFSYENLFYFFLFLLFSLSPGPPWIDFLVHGQCQTGVRRVYWEKVDVMMVWVEKGDQYRRDTHCCKWHGCMWEYRKEKITVKNSSRRDCNRKLSSHKIFVWFWFRGNFSINHLRIVILFHMTRLFRL